MPSWWDRDDITDEDLHELTAEEEVRALMNATPVSASASKEPEWVAPEEPSGPEPLPPPRARRPQAKSWGVVVWGGIAVVVLGGIGVAGWFGMGWGG